MTNPIKHIYILLAFLLLAAVGCTPEDKSEAQAVVDAAINAHGGQHLDQSVVTFRFRDRQYRALRDNGALLIRHHRADVDCGVFYRSPERKKLYDEGQFVPTHGLVIWPRKEMLAWADAHPELADPSL